MEHESEDDTDLHAGYSHQRIGTRTGGLGNKRTSGDYPNDKIVDISQNTESPGDLKRLALTQTPVENNQITLQWKILKWEKW